MSIIEEIKRDINVRWDRGEITSDERRRKIAWLERLEEPTTKMVEAFYRAYERPLSTGRWESPFSNGWEALLKAVEEDLP